MVFPEFPMIFPDFPIIFPDVPMVFRVFPMVFPCSKPTSGFSSPRLRGGRRAGLRQQTLREGAVFQEPGGQRGHLRKVGPAIFCEYNHYKS